MSLPLPHMIIAKTTFRLLGLSKLMHAIVNDYSPLSLHHSVIRGCSTSFCLPDGLRAIDEPNARHQLGSDWNSEVTLVGRKKCIVAGVTDCQPGMDLTMAMRTPSRRSGSPYPAHAGCVTASDTALCSPYRSDRAIAERCADRRQPRGTELRTSL